MKSMTLIAALFLCLGLCAGVFAAESIRPIGTSWQRVGQARQLGYVEGFGLRQDTKLDLDESTVMAAMTELYAQPQNLPIRWDSAVTIADAMASGVPVKETDLQIIRKSDADLTAVEK